MTETTITKEQQALLDKKNKLAKLLTVLVTANMLSENLEDDFLDKKLFQRQTKFHAKQLCECVSKDIIPLYKSMQTSESVQGYTEIFKMIEAFIHQLTEEITSNIEL